MRRGTWKAALLCTAAGILVLGQASAQRASLPEPLPALRKFDGVLYGEVDAVRRDAGFTGLILRIALVEPSQGSPPVELRRVAGQRVAIAVSTRRDGRPRFQDLAEAFRGLTTRQAVRVDARATGPEQLLYARSIQPTGLNPTAATSHATVPGATATPTDLQQMNDELRTLRRDLARLQQDVAELRLLTRDLDQRIKR